jgi:hypothetical protein
MSCSRSPVESARNGKPGSTIPIPALAQESCSIIAAFILRELGARCRAFAGGSALPDSAVPDAILQKFLALIVTHAACLPLAGIFNLLLSRHCKDRMRCQRNEQDEARDKLLHQTPPCRCPSVSREKRAIRTRSHLSQELRDTVAIGATIFPLCGNDADCGNKKATVT